MVYSCGLKIRLDLFIIFIFGCVKERKCVTHLSPVLLLSNCCTLACATEILMCFIILLKYLNDSILNSQINQLSGRSPL